MPDDTISCVIHHEVKEMGTHMYMKINLKYVFLNPVFLDWCVKFPIRAVQEYQCHLENFIKLWF